MILLFIIYVNLFNCLFSTSVSQAEVDEAVDGRIAYGHRALEGQFPFMAALVLNDNSICGGSLINSDHVLTAAHCFPDDLKSIDVHFGSVDSYSENMKKVIGVGYIIHPDFNKMIYLANDIGIVRLASKVDDYPLVKLPSKDFTESIKYLGENFIAIGFGADETGNLSRYLMWTNMTVVQNTECGNEYGGFLCLKGEGKSETRHGDSGSALLLGDTIVGIDSFGIYNRSGFIRVDRHLKWISENIADFSEPVCTCSGYKFI